MSTSTAAWSTVVMPALHLVACPMCGGGEAVTVLHADELRLADRALIPWRVVRCRVCGLVYVNPRCHPQDPQKSYDGEVYGFARSRLADALTGGRPHADRVIDGLETLVAPGSLLDVGCGEGDLLESAERRGWRIMGIEVSAAAAEAARQRGLDVFTGTLRQAQLAPDTFDAVSLLDVVEHFENPVAELAEAHRILRPGGILVVETPNWNSVYRRVLGRWWAALQPRVHVVYFEERTLSAMLRRSGFEPVASVHEVGAVLSAEGRARGLSITTLHHVLRDRIVRWRLRRTEGILDRALLRIGSARRADARASTFARRAERARPGELPGQVFRPPSRLSMSVNSAVDRIICRRGMGEQLRIYARKMPPA